MHPIEAFVRNPVKVAVGVLLVALFGVIGLMRMPMQLTPEVQIPTITIETPWPGASPQEVEREIVQEQEEQLKGVENATRLSSESMDSMGRILIEFAVGTDMGKALLLVNSRLQQVSDYPEDAKEPVITTSSTSNNAIAWFILSPRMPSPERLRAFLEKYPDLAETLSPVLRAHNDGLAALRLRRLLSSDPRLEQLIPARPDIDRIAEFARWNPQFAEALDEVRRATTVEAQAARLWELIEAHPELAPLKPLPIDVGVERKFARDVIEARFERVEGVANSNVFGGLDPELQVIVDPAQLAARQLTIGDLRLALRAENRDTSGGDFWEGKRRYVVRTLGQFRSPQQVAETLVAIRDGRPVFVKDVAQVQLGYKKPSSIVRRFGTTAIAINAERETGANVLEVMAGLKAAAAELNEQVLHARGLALTQAYDETEYIYASIDLVRQNIILGGSLTVIVLMFFLHLGVRTLAIAPLILLCSLGALLVSPWLFVITIAMILGAGFWFARGALVVGLAIPTSIVGTFLLLNLMGRSLNVISLAGLAFAIGMLVDNAVVVLENVYRHYQSGASPFAAAVRATKEVWGAVVASTLTTIAVFLPVIFVREEAGQLFLDIALAICCAVGLSLLVSVTVIPTAAARLLRRRGDRPRDAARSAGAPQHLPPGAPAAQALPSATAATGVALVGRLAKAWVEHVVGVNAWVQRTTSRRLAVVVTLVGAAVLLTWTLWPPVEYLPKGNRNLVFGFILPSPGYNLDELVQMGEMLEEELLPYWDVDLDEIPARQAENPMYVPIEDFFYVAAGRRVFMGMRSRDPHRAGLMVPLVFQVAGRMPGAIVFADQVSLFGRDLTAGRAVDVEITGPQLERLVALGGQIMGQVVEEIPGARPFPQPSLDLSNPEVHVLRKAVPASELGVSSTDLGYAVNALVDGAYAADYFSGGEKIDLVIMGRADFAARTQDLEELPIATPAGRLVPLGAIAHVRWAGGPEQINRRERQRAITIQVTPPDHVPLETALRIIENNVVAPIRKSGQLEGGYQIHLSGTADKLRDTWRALRWNVLLAVLITYLLMAALFESWFYPLVVIVSVPLGAVGGVLGLYLLNGYLMLLYQPPQKLDVLTMLGFVILIGTVVNNAILLVHQALNHIREDDLAPREAILQSVRTRIRPIFMTTATTVFGLSPLVLFPGTGSELYRGLGGVVLGGLVVSTMFTLLLVPTLFSLVMDFRQWLLGGVSAQPVPGAEAPAEAAEAYAVAESVRP